MPEIVTITMTLAQAEALEHFAGEGIDESTRYMKEYAHEYDPEDHARHEVRSREARAALVALESVVRALHYRRRPLRA
jgi:hypothetical protein